ncbi:MAG: glucose-1-phosphate adenylyltransferase [Burkholderiaceae bacterium]
MPTGKNVLAFVMAGGEGSRLSPLTADRSKPSVPFNGQHRIVDFVLSNLVNSEIDSIYLLVQYKSQSLIEHVRRTWTTGGVFRPRQFITVVPPQMHHGPEWFQGTADAVWQNLHLMDELRPDLVVVFGADHIYRMDVRQMVDHHVRTGADVTVATLPVPMSAAQGFGIVEVGANRRITRFLEKPLVSPPMPGRPGHSLASMGNYVFSADVLRRELQRARELGESDFGRHILPRIAPSHRLVAYDFATNAVPGVQDHEEHAYWRDVGTIDAYFDAHLDTLGARPRFQLTNPYWPIFSTPDQAASAQIEGGEIRRSVIGSGCVVNGARLDHAMLRRYVRVEEDARLDQCIVMERTRIGRGARLRRVIVDQDNDIPPNECIGFDAERDRARFTVSEAGIVVVPRAFFPRLAATRAGAGLALPIAA